MKRILMLGLVLFVCNGCGLPVYTMSASSGAPGDEITIFGRFAPVQGRTLVKFGEVFVPECAVYWGDKKITVPVPRGYYVGDTVDVTLLLPDGTTVVTLGQFTYTGLDSEGEEGRWFLSFVYIMLRTAQERGVSRPELDAAVDESFNMVLDWLTPKTCIPDDPQDPDGPCHDYCYFHEEGDIECDLYSELPLEKRLEFSERVAKEHYLVSLDRAYLDQRSGFYMCYESEKEWTVDEVMAMWGDILPGIIQGGAGYSLASDNVNPWADTVDALGTIGLACTILAPITSGWSIPLALGTMGLGATAAQIVMKDGIDNASPQILGLPGVYTQKKGTTYEFRITVDDMNVGPNDGLISGVDYAMVRSAEPDPSVRVSMEPRSHEQWDGPIGAVDVDYDVRVIIDEDCPVQDGHMLTFIVDSYDMQGNTRTRYFDLVIDEPEPDPYCGDDTVDPGEECDPPGSYCGTGGTCTSTCDCHEPEPPFIGSLNTEPATIRKNYYGDDWRVVFGITSEADLNMVEIFFTGASSKRFAWGQPAGLNLISIDYDYGGFQSGVIEIDRMGKETWLNPGWHHLTLKVWDILGRFDERYDSTTLYVKPQFTPYWSTWRFTKQGSTSTFIATLYSNGDIIIDGCCCSRKTWSWINQDRIRILAWHDGCCEHFKDGNVAADLSTDGNKLTGTSFYGPWSATKLSDSETSAMSAEVTAMSICTEHPYMHDVIDMTGESAE